MTARIPKRYAVYRGEEKVLQITDRPGPLVSKVAPPPLPGAKPAWHPFLSVLALVPELEQELAEILERSRTTEEYLANLEGAGYRVEKEF